MNPKRNSPLLSECLSKRQRKRLQRRLSRANAVQPEDTPTKEVLNLSTGLLVNESSVQVHPSDWHRVTARSSSSNPLTGSNGHIELCNAFGLLNHSQHEESFQRPQQPPHSQRALSKGHQSNGHTSRRKLYQNGQASTNESTPITSRSATPDQPHTSSTSTPSHTSLRSGGPKLSTGSTSSKSGKKRSKSTSPPRKPESSVAKQKDRFKNFDPENVDWIQQPPLGSNSAASLVIMDQGRTS